MAGSLGSAVGIETAPDGPQVQTGTADEDRHAILAPRWRPGPCGRDATKSATLNGSSGSTRSRPWCGTRARSAAVALAVPMSRPR